jgi:hypothetical protein
LDYLTTHTSIPTKQRGFAHGFVNNKKDALAAASDNIYQFFSGTPASFTYKSGRRDIAEILLKVELNTKDQIRSKLSDSQVYNQL